MSKFTIDGDSIDQNLGAAGLQDDEDEQKEKDESL